MGTMNGLRGITPNDIPRLACRLELEGLDVKQDVRQYKDVLAKRLLPYRVRRTVSPYEFYLELTNFPGPRLYKNWYPTMQAFYENQENRETMQLFKGTPLPGRCYACKDSGGDGKWHRVRVHKSVKEPLNILTVFYLDLCKLQETKAENLLELHPEFATSPAQVFRCYLADVRTVGTQRDTDWSEYACSYFQDLVKNKDFLGITLYRSDAKVTANMPDFITNLGVVLVECVPGTRTPKPGVCSLNAQLIDAGFAAAAGVCAGCQHATQIENFVPFFDRVEFDALHPHPSNPSKNSALAKTGGPSAAAQELNMTVPSGLAFEDAESQGDSVAYYKNTTDYLPVEISNHLAGVSVVYVVNPSHIIVQLKSKQDNLKEMQVGIGRMVDKSEPLEEGKPGMCVACNILDFVNDKMEKTIWCRGVILKIIKKKDLPKAYKILLVDYGNVIEVEFYFIRQLPSYFEKIPSFAVRVHLDVENLYPVSVAALGSAEVANRFRKYLLEHTDKEPMYFLYHPRHAEKFQLEHYSQLILYNMDEKKWFINPEDNAPPASQKYLNELRDHPMMHSLFVSVGVELKYEIYAPRHHFWYFISITDILEEKGFLETRRKNKTGLRLHCEIVEAASSNQVESVEDA